MIILGIIALILMTCVFGVTAGKTVRKIALHEAGPWEWLSLACIAVLMAWVGYGLIKMW